MNVLAKDFMHQDVKTVSPDLSLTELMQHFASDQVSGYPVVDGNTIRGVVSAADVLRHLQVGTAGMSYSNCDEVERTYSTAERQTDEARVADLMSKTVVSVSPTDSLNHVAALMADRQIHRVMVVDCDRLMGIVTSLDIARACRDERVDISFRPPQTLDF